MRYDRSRGRNGPRVLLVDDPTGNLDAKTADHVFATLTALVARIWTLAAHTDRRVPISLRERARF